MSYWRRGERKTKLTHLCLSSLKWDIGKQCRPRSGVQIRRLIWVYTVSIKNENKNTPDTPKLGNGLVKFIRMAQLTSKKGLIPYKNAADHHDSVTQVMQNYFTLKKCMSHVTRKRVFEGLRPGKIQTSMLSSRSWLVLNFFILDSVGSKQQRRWSDRMDAQADLRLVVHIWHKTCVLMTWLI